MRVLALVLVLPALYVAVCGISAANRRFEAYHADSCAPAAAEYVTAQSGDVVLGTSSYHVEVDLNADYGAYIVPFPIAFSDTHYIGSGISVATPIDDLTITCVRITSGTDAIQRGVVRDTYPDQKRALFRVTGRLPEWRPGGYAAVTLFAMSKGSTYAIEMPPVRVQTFG